MDLCTLHTCVLAIGMKLCKFWLGCAIRYLTGVCLEQQHRFSYNEPMPVESCTQALCDLALSFGEDGEDGGGMVHTPGHGTRCLPLPTKPWPLPLKVPRFLQMQCRPAHGKAALDHAIGMHIMPSLARSAYRACRLLTHVFLAGKEHIAVRWFEPSSKLQPCTSTSTWPGLPASTCAQ